MRFRLVTVAILLAVASRGDGRPRDPDPLDSGSSQEAVVPPPAAAVASRSGSSPDSRQERPGELKDIQNMDQSLRTMATQLLNATAKRDDLVRIPEEKIVTIETPMQVVHISTRVEDAISKTNKAEEDDSSSMKIGIPVNSKFGHFEMSNPGHAMAMTEEEIEREMATATTSAQKQQPTTESMLSTWIQLEQLYPLATTTEGNNLPEDIQSNQIHSTTSTKLPSTIVKQSSMNTKPIRKTEPKPTTTHIEKSTEPSILITKVVKNASTIGNSNFVKVSTTLSTTSIENDVKGSESTEKKPQNQRTIVSTPTTIKPSTKKSPTKSSTTPKPKVTTPKNPVNKPSKASNSSNRVKHFSTKRPAANKNDTITSISKIEKVTLKPAASASQNRTESTEKPQFVTKIKASVLADAQKPSTASPTTMKSVHPILSKSNFSSTDSTNTKIPSPTQVNNVLKVHTKKPTDDTTKIEIQPIRVNPPVLTIEKIEDTSSDQKTDIEDPEILGNSKIDIKFDFNPNVQVSTSSSETAPSSTSSTKRPRPSNKRKKNKNRRRRPSSTTTTTTSASIPSYDEDATPADILDTEGLSLTEIQESKIEPESKAPPSKKKKPNHQTQVQKPFGTQIYNFLSREVMPSVGVMSLVGLGLGLASYFLYPFGGVISRRNYEVEPNYKYNLDEYGGNYGLSEEEVLSKVYSGMTGGQHHETKYKPTVTGEKNPNYYRYTGSEQSHQPHQPQPATRYPILATKNQGNRVIYRPVETTSYDTSYRNTEFKYPDVPTTPNYYERQRLQQQPTDFVPTVVKAGIGNNRQFVVGNIPKEYSSREADKVPEMLPMQDKIDINLQYQGDENYANNDVPSPPLASPTLETLGNPAALVLKVDEDQAAEVYEEVEINPTALAVEHGPRSLRSLDNTSKVKSAGLRSIRRKRSILPDLAGSFIPLPIPRFKSSRTERSSVIQVIPSKSEIEKERKQEEEEEDLSNEILDIIDEALPGKDHQKKRHDGKDHSITAAASKQHFKGVDHPVNNALKGTSSTTTTTTSMSKSSPSTTTSSTTTTTTTTQKHVKQVPSSTMSTTTTAQTPTEPDFVDQGETTLDWRDEIRTTAKPKEPQSNGMDIFGIAKRIAEVKLRLGLTILKHASEGFARYIGHIQKRFNGQEWI